MTLNEFRVILGHANQPERLFDCGIVCQHIQNITFLDGLPHRVHMERSLDGFTFQRHSHHGTEGFQSLPLGGSGEGKEGLIVMSTLADDRIDVLVCQIHFFLFDSGFFGILFDSNTKINQTTAERFCTFTILSLVSLVDDDGELAPTEFFHILLGEEELLDDTLFIVDGFCKTAGVLLIVNCFHQTDLMFKAVDGILQLAVQYHTVGDHNNGIEQTIILCIVNRGKTVCNPCNGVGFAGTCRVLN